MNEAEHLIKIYQTGFMACLILAILFFVLTTVLFFLFHMRKVIANRTGRAQKKGIAQMREENQRTGRLRHAEKVAMGEYTPVSLNAGTGVGDGQTNVQEEETEKIGDNFTENTVILSGQQLPSEGRFTMIREVMLIHTNELI